MGVMIIPFVSSLSGDVINAVPQAMRDGSYGLGATKSETIKQVIIPAALPGIVGEGMTALIVEQDIGKALSVSSRVYCLQEGRVSLERQTGEVSRDEITAAYFGMVA